MHYVDVCVDASRSGTTDNTPQAIDLSYCFESLLKSITSD